MHLCPVLPGEKCIVFMQTVVEQYFTPGTMLDTQYLCLVSMIPNVFEWYHRITCLDILYPWSTIFELGNHAWYTVLMFGIQDTQNWCLVSMIHIVYVQLPTPVSVTCNSSHQGVRSGKENARWSAPELWRHKMAAAASCDVTYDKRFISSPDTVVLLPSISSIYQC